MTFHDISTSKVKGEMFWIKKANQQSKKPKNPLHLLDNVSQSANNIMFQISPAVLKLLHVLTIQFLQSSILTIQYASLI